jgi:hypothetical protein
MIIRSKLKMSKPGKDFATNVENMHSIGPDEQCMDSQCPADRVRQHGRTAVGMGGVGIVLPTKRRRQQKRRHHHKKRLDTLRGRRQGQLGQLLHLPTLACQSGSIAHAPWKPGQQQL